MPSLPDRVCARVIAACLLALVSWGAAAQDQPRVAGSEGVPVPKRTKMVKPEYPAEAQAKGLRGIVILDLTIDAEGKVVQVDLIRSIPGLDEAAVEAVKKWEYEPVKVGGRAVPVRLTVPITFLMQLPELTRQAGIPELRQGAVPGFPKGSESASSTRAEAELVVDADGRVLEAGIRSGDAPFADALLEALRTWVFAPDPARGVVSFRVQADFGSGEQRRRVALSLFGLQQVENQPAAASQPVTAPALAPAAPGQVEPEPSPAAPPTAASAAPPSLIPPVAPSQPPQPTQPAPPTEVLRGPAEPPKSTETGISPEPGISAVRDVSLGPGVPELVRGRRPVPPPLARIAGVSGAVLVRLAIDAAGGTSVQGSEGPELLRPAAEQAVATWLFRRTTTDRVRAVAEIVYRDDGAQASVRLEP